MAALVPNVGDVHTRILNQIAAADLGGGTSGVASPGTVVVAGGRYDSTTPAAVDDGDAVELFTDAYGRPRVIDDGARNPSDDVLSSLSRQVSFSPAIVIEATPDYVDLDVVGNAAPYTLTAVNYASGKGVQLASLLMKENSGQVPALAVLFFRGLPAGGTYTDNGALALSAADVTNLVGVVSIATGDWVAAGGKAIAPKTPLLELPVTGTDLYFIIVAKGVYNAGAVGDLSMVLTFVQRY